MTVRVRFAPSPTGFLHIGGVRAALFNWLYARHHRGQFLLRIEDTDLERSEQRYTDDILASLKWLGLNWDEEPIYQGKRLEIYLQAAEDLISKGHAYRCYCTEEEVEKMREKAMAEGTRPQYDRRCRKHLGDLGKQPKDKKHVIRAAVPLDGHIEFNDLIRGPIRVENTEVDDFVLIRSNGAPTYNLSVVVDDVASRMTHIIRGDDHINNTPKQLHLYKYFGYPVPEFAHMPMILGPDKKKLSKRHGAVSANVYRQDGFLPEALLNFLARLGWSHGDQEVFTVGEMVKLFSFDHVQKSSGVFNLEKLLWLNGSYIRGTTPARLAAICAEDYADFFKSAQSSTSNGAIDRLKTPIGEKLVAQIQPKVKVIKELAEQLVPLVTPGAVEGDPSELKWNKDANLKTATKAAVKHLHVELGKKVAGVKASHSGPWGSSPTLADAGLADTDIDALFRQIGEQHGVKLGDLMQPVRLCVTGRMVSASVFHLLVILPWDVIDPRLAKVETI
jgi:glutamyl-tRNA synthetase